MKRTIKALAVLLTLALVISVAAMSAFAVTEYTAIPGTTTDFNKDLVIGDDVESIPDLVFEFKIDAGEPQAAGENQVEILAGPVLKDDDNNVTAPTVETASFNSSMIDNAEAGDPTDDTATNKVHITDSVTVNLAGVTFTKPGIYRYKITEQNGNIPGVTYDSNPDRYLDVFVVDDNGTLVIQNYALRTQANSTFVFNQDENKYEYSVDPEVKSSGYTNKFENVDLEFKKVVTGNQADKSKQFRFKLEITNAVPGNYAIEVSRQDVIQSDSNVNEGNTITVDEQGEYVGYFYLADGDTVKVNDLNTQYGYTLTEEAEDYQSTAGCTDYTDDTFGTAITVDKKTGFTNAREGIIPTGVIITVAPFMIGLLLFGAVMMFMISRRRRASY